MDFEEILKQLRQNLLGLIVNQYGELKDEGEEAVNQFLDASKLKLKKWTELLALNKITLEEFEWLLNSQKDLFEMNALHKAGISKISLGQFKNKAIKTIVDVVCKILL
ncbi:hypothetical protein [Mesonia sp. K4-1]|uniref:hypothetical protein n=1 Tax=Mesonia sp. K4-1 TaxID=2602760 RepID=UPI0011CCB21B|nr:hypothetical protein [Mesonia sp. K4-1]TXK74414.1 hypothetical protein FT986_11510 [Mesonia sp. K4-1]